MSTRITLVRNSNQQIRTVLLLSSDRETWNDSILAACKNKLQLKKAAKCYVRLPSLDSGVVEVSFRDRLEFLENDSVLFASAGEVYVGKESVVSFDELHRHEDKSKARVSILHSKANLEATAIKQLQRTSMLDAMVFVIGMPDLHAGQDSPIGAVFGVSGKVYPSLIGGDIGCGMTLFKLSTLSAKQLVGNEKQLAAQITQLEGPWEGSTSEWLNQAGLESSVFDNLLGTVGRGNHFAEIQVVESIVQENSCHINGLSSESTYLLVHSGSRGLGKSILEEHTKKFGKDPLVEGTDAFAEYMQKHDFACQWARRNRDLIAHRVFDALSLGSSHRKLLDIWHNNVEKKALSEGQEVYLHRKGAAPSDQGFIVIPGSRGTFSYVVEPVGDQQENGFSVAHGAGREMSRTSALQANQGKFESNSKLRESLSMNQFGGVVVCDDLELLCEEAPNAYKDIDSVVSDLVEKGIVRIIAVMKPLVTYKMKDR
ncbi:tRNA-splicing ligase [Cladochytrium replicatum]|nr:tRNA-splicing ligase [Cladochytrium replicatum]